MHRVSDRSATVTRDFPELTLGQFASAFQSTFAAIFSLESPVASDEGSMGRLFGNFDPSRMGPCYPRPMVLEARIIVTQARLREGLNIVRTSLPLIRLRDRK